MNIYHKRLFCMILGSIFTPLSFAAMITESASVITAVTDVNQNYTSNANQTYINPNSYIENMYANQPSGGGTQFITESGMINQSLAQKLFEDGTWNAWGGGSGYMNHTNQAFTPSKSFATYGYGASIFGQTGRIDGFALGGQFTIDNPWFANNMNGQYEYNYVTMPSMPLTQLNQAYFEYQYSNLVQADVGWITISNSPWLMPAAALGHMMPAASYQGGEVNVYPGGGWLLTGIAFNAAQLAGQVGYSSNTFYNSPAAYGNGLIVNGVNAGSDGTVALGANYSALNNNYTLRLWGYNFDNYGTLLYADTNLTMNATNDLSFNVALQGGTDNGNSSANAFSNNGLPGQISSNFAGAMGTVTLDWATLGAAYTSIWGPDGSFGNGGIVSPYTVNVNTDPLFANSWNYNMVNVGAASSGFKAFSKFNFLNGNLWIKPTYGTYTSTSPAWNGTQEYDLLTSYSIPQIPGLNIFNVWIYEVLPEANASSTLMADQIVLGYTY